MYGAQMCKPCNSRQTRRSGLRAPPHDARLLGGGDPSTSSRSRLTIFDRFSLRDEGKPGGARGALYRLVNVFSESGVESLSRRPLALCTRESVRFLRGGVAGREGSCGGVSTSVSVSVSDASGSSVTVLGIVWRMAL